MASMSIAWEREREKEGRNWGPDTAESVKKTQAQRNWEERQVKGGVCPKMRVLSLFIHLCVVPSLYDFSMHLQWIAIKDFKLQKGHKIAINMP